MKDNLWWKRKLDQTTTTKVKSGKNNYFHIFYKMKNMGLVMKNISLNAVMWCPILILLKHILVERGYNIFCYLSFVTITMTFFILVVNFPDSPSQTPNKSDKSVWHQEKYELIAACAKRFIAVEKVFMN